MRYLRNHSKTTGLGVVLFAVLFLFLQLEQAFHFFFLEQNFLFLYDGAFFAQKIVLPGGLAEYMAGFLTQFFIMPYAGAGITAFLLTAVGVLTMLVGRKLAPGTAMYLLYVLPVAALLLLHFNHSYLIQGTIAYVFALAALYLYIRCKDATRRLIVGAISVPLLYWLGGSVAVLYAGCVLLYELLIHPKKAYLPALLLGEALLIAWAAVYFSWADTFPRAFLPDMYYFKAVPENSGLYYAWIALPVVLVVSFFLGKKLKAWSGKKEIASTALQCLCIGGLAFLVVSEDNQKQFKHLKELDYYRRTQQWSKIEDASKGKMDNYLYLFILNTTLIEQGVLAERLFDYDQHGAKGLFVNWDKTATLAAILSDFHFAMGNTALAQEMAFEGYVSSMGEGNPRLLMRLVQTNLIYGAWGVAEKYLDILEKTLYYKEWAKAHRRFLYNDAAVNDDPLLGGDRKSLVQHNYLSNPRNLTWDILALARTNPENQNPIDYYMTGFLLDKNLEEFAQALEGLYGSRILPALPRSLQEAVMIITEGDPARYRRYNISEDVVRRFADFNARVLQNNTNAAGVAYQSFRNTYWYYYMFK